MGTEHFNSFCIDYDYLAKKIQENHANDHLMGEAKQAREKDLITSKRASVRDFVRFEIHATSDVIE
jgi:hypothetical protein